MNNLKTKLSSVTEATLDRDELRDELILHKTTGHVREGTINYDDSEPDIIKYVPRPNVRKAILMGVAIAAASILSFEFTNNSGSVIADPDTGFFHWLKKDHTGITFVTSPQPEISGVTPSALDMDPELVSKAFYVPEGLPQNMVLNSIAYLPGEDNYKYYYTNGTQYLEVGSVPRRGYNAEDDGYEYNVSMITHNNMADFWLKEKECLGTYPYDGRIYYIKGNFDVEKIIEMTDGMAGYLKAPKEEAADEE